MKTAESIAENHLSPLTRPEWVRLNEPLAKKTTLQIGGPADYYGEPPSLQALEEALAWAKSAQLPVAIMGRGSNLLVRDDGYRGLVIRFAGPWAESLERLSEAQILVGAGVRLKQLCGQAASWGIGGFEFLEGIPGSIGGALCMNAGAMGAWMWDVVEWAEVLENGHVKRITPESAGAGYRHCAALENAIALRACLRGYPEAPETIRQKIESYSQKRKASQPRESSAGCLFKNPEGASAGQWIDACGLKGHTIGGAAISHVHANFMINTGNATAEDVLNLITSLREKVFSEKGTWLETEVRVL